MRPARELIKELKAAAKTAAAAGILLVWEKRIEIVQCRPPGRGDSLRELEIAVSRGGLPIGILTINLIPNPPSVRLRVFHDIGEDERTLNLCRSIGVMLGLWAASQGLRASAGGWELN